MINCLINKKKLSGLDSSDIYEGKIKTLYRAYGLDYKFCRFYEQGASLLISQLDRDFVIKQYADNGEFDAEELAGFLKHNRASGVFLSPEVLKSLEPFINGEYLYNNLMEYDACFNVKESGLLDGKPVLDDVFDIVKHDFNVTYDLWLTDASHRERHGISKFYLYGGKSTATVLYDDSGVAFITQVATKKEERGKGLATNMLRELAEGYKNKSVLLVCRDRMLGFYEKTGFKKIGGAAQIYRLEI